MSEATRTYQTRIPLAFDEILSGYASLMARTEHCLFAEFAKGKNVQSLKSSTIKNFGITARQFNAIRVRLEGKIDSIHQRRLQRIEQKRQQSKALVKHLPFIKNAAVRHQKRRRLANLQSSLNRLEKETGVSLCFGSKKLFHKQFALEKNSYATHAEWNRDWQQARSSEIFVLGSKDETGGNQTCTASIAVDESIALRIRLPDSLISKYGKYLVIPNLRFAYGHEAIVAALQNCCLRKQLLAAHDATYQHAGQAISFRFKKDVRGWTVFVSTDISLPQPITNKAYGVIGVDINSDHLAVVETDRFGNVVSSHSFALACKGATTCQIRAVIGDASKQIVALCEQTKKPLVVEKLDFQKKKAELREKSNSCARMLSAFAYNAILTHLKARGASKGIQVYSVNPAFTSLIGRVNYAKRYGLSIHHAAALCIGRRYLGFSEKLPQGRREIPDGKGGHVALDLPARNRSRHVWQQWGQLNKKISAALTAHVRTARSRSLSSRKAALEIAIPDLVGGIPIRESLTKLLC